jgi:dTDP-4-amino-4,6-dideoxygalactose transaminase
VRINVTKTFLPPINEYQTYLGEIWETGWITNNGKLVQELESRLKKRLNLENLLFVSNGTIALQLAIKALDLKGEIITTPYSYCATATSILWENCKPVFVDINEHDLNLNPSLIEEKITSKTSGIIATHVYGNPCNVDQITDISQNYNLPVIYDAAHAFDAYLRGKSLLAYGDISTCSFHATKVFHSVEGGSVSCNDHELNQKLVLYRSFGHINDIHHDMGINGKNSEFHAAMGLSNLPYVTANIEKRKIASEAYDNSLNYKKLFKPHTLEADFQYNYAYYPVVFDSGKTTDAVISALNAQDIFPRRYFHPSLNKLGYMNSTDSCPVSESVVNRVLSLPLYPDLDLKDVERISDIINKTL